jgi:signal transduction histidine kinase
MNKTEQFQSLVSKEFISKLSHHTRSPFNGLLGFSELLLLNKKKLKSADADEYLLRVNMLAKKAFISSENMMMWLKIITGNIQAQSISNSFSSILEHAYNLNKEGIQLKKINFQSEVEPNFTIKGDSFLLNCIFANLISKAVKLGSDESQIILKATTVKEVHSILVSYSGMEIESEVVRNFFSSQNTTPNANLFEPELDIELWICYQLAKLQNLNFGVTFLKNTDVVFSITA